MHKFRSICIWILYITFLKVANLFGQGEVFSSQIIQNIPPNGIIINEPGRYVFANDIIWTPITDSIAVTIQANNVILDMQGFTLLSTPILQYTCTL